MKTDPLESLERAVEHKLEKSMAQQYYIKIVSYESGETVKEIGPYASERSADRGEAGVNVNLDHERFYTEIEPREGEV